MTGNTTDINIRESADRVIALLEQNRPREAMQLLEHERQGERTLVQESLDRYVAAGAREQLAALRRPGAIAAADAPAFRTTLDRLHGAEGSPRFPIVELSGGSESRTGTNELRGLTSTQQYDVYASIVQVHGSQAARDAIDSQDRVILGLRQENSTVASQFGGATSGRGLYNDRLVVLWKDAEGGGHVYAAHRANTEPTAQYDHHAGSAGRRPFADGGFEGRRAASPGYENVLTNRKIEGEDVDGDGLRDLGRMADGTYEMERTTHAWPGRPGQVSFSLRPTAAAVRNGALQIERDSNADGWFTDADVSGRQPLNNSFKIHLGSIGSTDSAGCQTIHSGDAEGFIAAAQGTAGQTRWQYVLVETSPEPVRNRGLENEAEPDMHRAPARVNDRAPQQAPLVPQHQGAMQRIPLGSADSALFDTIQRQLPEGTSAEHAAHAYALARESGIRELHQLDRVAVVDGQAWVVGRTPGFFAKVDLGEPAPPMQESLQRVEGIAQQELLRSAERQEAALGPAMRMT